MRPARLAPLSSSAAMPRAAARASLTCASVGCPISESYVPWRQYEKGSGSQSLAASIAVLWTYI